MDEGNFAISQLGGGESIGLNAIHRDDAVGRGAAEIGRAELVRCLDVEDGRVVIAVGVAEFVAGQDVLAAAGYYGP